VSALSLSQIFAGIGLAIKDGPAISEAINEGLQNKKIMAGVAAAADVFQSLAKASSVQEAHAILIDHGVDPEKVLEAIKEKSAGNPDAFNAGSNNVSP
jgi:hypothetical protein